MADDLSRLSEGKLVELLRDPHWRLRNLYVVLDKSGKIVRFEPWPEQEKFLQNIWYRNVVPKARQRGFSTVVQLMMLDACVFVPATSAGVIAQDEATALKIFAKKIKLAWDHLPGLVHEMVPVRYSTKHEMVWTTNSSIVVSSSARGDTLQYLHVSEYGKICAQFPDRANEIQEGSLPAVDQFGVVVIESTVETPYGNFSDMVRAAEAIQQTGRELTPMDYRLHFASWWDADEYETDPENVVLSPKDVAYFNRIEGEIGHEIGPRKRAWYVKKRDSDFGGEDEKMWRQYPSTLKEAFTVSAAGLWLSTQLANARRDGRICKLPLVPTIPVNTWWDLGVDDDLCCWLHQEVGPWDHFVGFIEMSGEAYSPFVRAMQEAQARRGFVWGKHYLPHDGDQRRPGAESLKTPRDMLAELGLKNIEIVPRIDSITLGIDQLREDFPNYRIDEEHCAEGIKHLEGFSKVWNDRMGLWSPQIMKNGHQHAADALRQKAQWAHNLRGGGGQNRPRRANRSGMAA